MATEATIRRGQRVRHRRDGQYGTVLDTTRNGLVLVLWEGPVARAGPGAATDETAVPAALLEPA